MPFILSREHRERVEGRTNWSGSRMLKRLALALLAALLAGPASAATCRDIAFPDTVKVGGADLVLNGLGIRKATLLRIKVYVAALYLPQKSGDAAAILGANGRWQLTLHFVRDVDASDIRDAFQEGFQKAAGDWLGALQQRIAALNAQ